MFPFIAIAGVIIAFGAVPSVLGRSRETPVYSNEFAVNIPEGDATADILAAKHGFVNKGQVSFLIVAVIW